LKAGVRIDKRKIHSSTIKVISMEKEMGRTRGCLHQRRKKENPLATIVRKMVMIVNIVGNLHPELRPKQFGGKGKPKTIAIVQHDLGSDSGDEERIATFGMQGKYSFYACSSSSNESHDDDIRRSELFHIRFLSEIYEYRHII
jgi:hypothetical protein